MNRYAIGDLSQSWVSQRNNNLIKSQINRLNAELSSGKAADIPEHLGGDLAPLAALEADLSRTQSFISATQTASNLASALQETLQQIQMESSDFSTQLLIADGPLQQMALPLSQEASARLSDVSTLLNTRYAGQSLFAGAATGQPAVADASITLSGLFAALGGDTSPSNIRQEVDNWFSPGGGFDATGYLGSSTPASGHRLDDSTEISLRLTAHAPAFRQMLSGLALAALTEHASAADRGQLLKDAGEILIQAEAMLGDDRATLGFAEQRLAAHQTALTAQADGYEMARAALIGKDPFETAGALQQAQTQMELLYTLTARMSSLTLVNFLR
ncbi:flagellin [Thalassobius sp. MITS945101]|uniref:flagellin n=1 Tax=Thalassobius sp. MITS945101 TaxID=3096994 RepID=UPI00399992E5